MLCDIMKKYFKALIITIFVIIMITIIDVYIVKTLTYVIL